MYNQFQTSLKYLKYYLSSSNGKGHGIHSPFIFQFITQVLNDRTIYPEFGVIEELRDKLKKDDTIIRVEDLGAGAGRIEQRSVSSIATRSLKSKKFGQLFFRMIKKYCPKTILELGTSLGITTSYLSLADPSAQVITMEGAVEIANIAEENFRQLELKNIELVRGNFDDTLRSALAKLSQIDLAFIDGNHRQEPTERYFKEILSKTNNDSIIILDDIHWSRDMELAWRNIIAHRSVTCSVDLYFAGILFFRQEFKEKQHFAIRF